MIFHRCLCNLGPLLTFNKSPPARLCIPQKPPQGSSLKTFSCIGMLSCMWRLLCSLQTCIHFSSVQKHSQVGITFTLYLLSQGNFILLSGLVFFMAFKLLYYFVSNMLWFQISKLFCKCLLNRCEGSV